MGLSARLAVLFAISVIGSFTMVSCSKALESAAQPSSADFLEKTADSVAITKDQMSSLRIQPASEVSFRAQIIATGRISIDEEKATPVLGAYTGKVSKVFATIGAVVKVGDPLMELDSPDIAQAEADALNVQASLGKAKVAVALADKNIALAQRNFELSNSNIRRQHQLYDAKSIAQKDFEQAQRDATQAEKDVEQSRVDAENARNDVQVATSSLEASRHRLEIFGKQPCEVDALLKDRVPDHRIVLTASAAGTIISRKVAAGQFLRQDNTDALFVIADLSSMWAIADVAENDLPAIRLGEKANIRLLAFPEEDLSATIMFVSPSVDPNTRRGQVRCMLPNPDHRFRNDMFCTFRIESADNMASPAVPSSAIFRSGGRAFVWTPTGATRFARHVVRTGLVRDGLVQVLDGVTTGEQVVTAGVLFLDAASD